MTDSNGVPQPSADHLVLRHNYYELAKFVLFCIKRNQSVASSTAHTLGHMSDETARVLEAVSTVFLSSSRLESD